MSDSQGRGAVGARAEGPVSKRRLVEALGIQPRRVDPLRDAGMPAERHHDGSWRYDVEACRAWLDEHRSVLEELDARAAGNQSKRGASYVDPSLADDGEPEGEATADTGGAAGAVAWDVIESSAARAAVGESVDGDALARALVETGTHRSVFEGMVASRRAALRSERRAELEAVGRAEAQRVREEAKAARAELNEAIARRQAEAEASERLAALLERGVGVECNGDEAMLRDQLASIEDDCRRAKHALASFNSHAESQAKHNDETRKELRATYERLRSERVAISKALDDARHSAKKLAAAVE